MRRPLIGAAACLLAGAAMALDAGYGWPLPEWMPPPPVPADTPMSAAKVELGRYLFHDARLSRDGTVACASCHVQALVPLFGENPDEMGGVGQDRAILARLLADPHYARAVPAAFPGRTGPDLFTVTRALAAFQRSLVSVNPPHDRFKRRGEATALFASARRGEQVFFDHRFECCHCHSGVHVTDTIQTALMPEGEVGFHNTGLCTADPATAPGLIEITGRPQDAGRFRTPSLRNVAVTAPYMQDGSIPDLRGVILLCANAGRAPDHPMKDGLIQGFTATEAEIADLIAFLESLTDEEFLTDPRLSDPWPEGHPASVTRQMP